MNKLFVVALAAVVCLVAIRVEAAIPAHLITNLPGWTGNTPSPQYSGYITINQTTGKSLHYWFVESENNPATDPVVLWMNGGPGCSSLDGYFYEQGPFHFDQDAFTDDTPALQANPYRWNKIANMIFLEAPAGVGFSYSNDPNDYNTDDNKTAHDNYLFLLGFFAAYPEYANNPFYVSGESYAGIYVPTLVYQIDVGNQQGGQQINLKGFMVGNGCTGNAVGICSPQGTQISIDFLFGHGLYSASLHDKIVKNCANPTSPSPACIALLTFMGNEVGDVNIYDIYGPCINGGGSKLTNVTAEERVAYSRGNRIPNRPLDVFLPRGPDECIDGIYAGRYLNNDTVRAAIHVKSIAELGQWSVCTGNINYNSDTPSLYPIYPTLIKNYRTLIYNGDVDACVPYNDNEKWTSNLGISIAKDWHQWLAVDESGTQQVAGYAINYDLNGFAFVTVKGAGHMVPEYKPIQAFAMFQKFLNNEPF